MSRRAKQKKWRTEEEERRHEKGERRWRRRRRRKENPSTLEKRASSLGCESRTCAKPALTAKLPFSTSVFPLILSTSVYYVYSLARARSSKKCDVLRENLSFFFPRAVFFEVREWSNAPEIDIWQTSPFDDVLFFFDEHQEKRMSCEPMRMGACMWLLEKWMMDDSRPSTYITSLVFTIIYI